MRERFLKFLRNGYIENFAFLVVALFNLIPAFSYRFFPTMDGAAHLYNAKLIQILAFDNIALYEQFYMFNELLVPNWIGHFILSFSGLLLPAYLAEKLLLLLYLIGLPYAFRSFICKLNPGNSVLSFLIFPFCYSFVFTFGFYNFSLALVLMFIILAYSINYQRKKWTSKQTMVIGFLLTLLYFSHLVICGLTMLFLGLKIIWDLLYEHFHQRSAPNKTFQNVIKSLIKLLLASSIPLMLSYFYFAATSSGAPIYEYFPKAQLIDWIYEIRPLISYNEGIEAAESSKMWFIIAFLIGFAIYARIRDHIKSANSNLLRKNDFCLLICLICLLLYFTLPNTDGNAGYITLRMGLLFFLFLISWLASQKHPKWLLGVVSIAFLYFHFNLNSYYSRVSKDLNQIAVDCENTSQYIAENSIVLPIYYTSNWLIPHFSNYLGIDKPMIIMENYELDQSYFPLKWNDSSIPNIYLGNRNTSQDICKEWRSNPSNEMKPIDYVFIIGKMAEEGNSCDQSLKTILSNHFSLVHQNSNGSLYKLNS